MTAQELREKIARIISPFAFIDGFGDPDTALSKADQIIALVEEAGYEISKKI